MTARLIPDATTGAILRKYLVGQHPAVESALSPVNAGATLEFDEESNAALWADVFADHRPYTLLAGILRKSGVIQTIAADSQQETDRKALPAIKSQIEGYMGLSDLPIPADLADIGVGSNAAAIVAYINSTLLPRINQLDALVTRVNANTNAAQGIFRILRYIGIKLGVLT